MHSSVVFLFVLVAVVTAFNASVPAPYVEIQSSSKLLDLVGKSPGGDSTLEGSGVFYRTDIHQAYIVCDNLPSQVIQLGNATSDDTYQELHWTLDFENYEGITFDNSTKTFYIVSEAVHVIGLNRYKARILSFNENFLLQSANFIDYPFRDGHKGVEGLASMWRNGTHYLLALCEGNHCKGGDKGKEFGGGTILVSRFDSTLGDREGTWVVDAILNLPSNLPFEDYAGVDVFENRFIVVISQSSRMLWAGQISPDTWTIEGGKNGGDLFAFPLNDLGEKEFCNVEGVSWVDSATVVVSSDKPDDDAGCTPYSESATIFKIPFQS